MENPIKRERVVQDIADYDEYVQKVPSYLVPVSFKDMFGYEIMGDTETGSIYLVGEPKGFFVP